MWSGDFQVISLIYKIVATANSSKDNYSDCFLQLKFKTIDKNMEEEITHIELSLA